MTEHTLRAIGCVESTLTDLGSAPRQPDEGAPDAWLVLEERYAAALDGLHPGDDVLLTVLVARITKGLLDT